MDIKHFKLIKTIAEEGSIANSSEKLFLTQSALSHQLKDIELQAGFKVFHRSRNQWSLTKEGEELYQLSTTVLKSIDQSFHKIQKIKSGSIGHIKISTECYSFYQGLPRFIQKMGVLYPEINVHLILEATHHPIEKLLNNEIDIAITATKPNDSSLSSIEFFKDEIHTILHKEHHLAQLNYIEAHHFTDLHLIIHSYPLETVSVYQHFLKPNKTFPTKTSAIPLTEVALELVEANFGVMCMPKWALKAFKLSDDLVFKKISSKGFKRSHYLVIRKTDESKKYINDFILNFKEEFSSIK